MHPLLLVCLTLLLVFAVAADACVQPEPKTLLLKPDRVFDGESREPHGGWVVLVRGSKIGAVGPAD